MTIYVTDDAFSVKAKRFNKMFTSILALFFLLSLFLFCEVHGSIHSKLWDRRDAEVIDMYFQE